MVNLYLMVGISESGKSTWIEKDIQAKRRQANNEYDVSTQILSPDAIRFKLLQSDQSKVYFDPKREPEVWEIFFSELKWALSSAFNYEAETELWKMNLYIDATNLTFQRRAQIYLRLLDSEKPQSIKRILVLFHTPLSVALARDAKRERKVGETVLAKQFLEFEKPIPEEYDELIEVHN